MKVRHFTKILTVFFVFAITFLAMPFFFAPQSALAEDFTSEIQQDENFSITMTATARQNSALPLVTKQDEDEKVTYFCFQWRDLRYLKFHIAAKNRTLKEGTYSFKVQHKQTENLTALLDTEEIVYEGHLDDDTLGKNRVLDLYYNVDRLGIDINATTFAGKDYGLYRFNFVYEREVEGQLKPFSLGDIYVAVLPDKNIKEIMENTTVKIVHSVSSSNRLINVFHLSFSDPDALRYVRPDLITWVAYGTGIDRVEYCLTEEMKNLDVELSNCVVIWENYDNIHGTNFVLDTKEIEGTWQAYAIVKDYDGEEYRFAPTEELSTIKVPPKNYLWLILLILGIVLVVLFIIALVILFILKKREKVW